LAAAGVASTEAKPIEEIVFTHTITSVDRLANRRSSGFDLNDFETAPLDDHLMSRTCCW
jgi:hypothetical protein